MEHTKRLGISPSSKHCLINNAVASQPIPPAPKFIKYVPKFFELVVHPKLGVPHPNTMIDYTLLSLM